MDTTTKEAPDGAVNDESEPSAKPLVLPSLEIKNFRAFRHLTIEKLGRVNLITGKNNVGKTSLLEALRLFSEEGAPNVVRDLLEGRDELGEPLQFVPVLGFVDPEMTSKFSIKDAWLPYIASLFNNKTLLNKNILSFTNEALSIGELRNQKNTLALKIEWGMTPPGEFGSKKLVLLDERNYQEHAIEAKPFLSVDKGDRNIRAFSFDESASELVYWQRASSSGSVFVGSHGLSSEERPRLWDDIALTEWKAELLTALRILAPQVADLAFREDQYRGKGRIPYIRQSNFVGVTPLKSLGEGMTKVLDIALSLANQSNGILLIDEIENGLHYSVLPDVWRLIFQTARRLNVQVFATTHSRDCIEAFQQAASEDDDPTSGVLVRLRNKDGNIISTIFDEDDLAVVTREGIEVR